MNSRTIIEEFMKLSKNIVLKAEIKQEINTFLKSFPRKDLRKRTTKLRLWKFFEHLRNYESLKDPIDGIMADFAEKWGKTLGKALRERRIS